MLRHIPNILTLLRVAFIPIAVYFLYLTEKNPGSTWNWYALAIFIVAFVTDWLDGFLARRWQVESVIGKLLDPLADKLITMAAFVMLASLNWIAGWLVVVVLAREIFINAVRSLAISEGIVIAAATGGKWKTTMQFFGIGFIMSQLKLPYFSFPLWGEMFIYISVVLSWSSAVTYLKFYFAAQKNI